MGLLGNFNKRDQVIGLVPEGAAKAYDDARAAAGFPAAGAAAAAATGAAAAVAAAGEEGDKKRKSGWGWRWPPWKKFESQYDHEVSDEPKEELPQIHGAYMGPIKLIHQLAGSLGFENFDYSHLDPDKGRINENNGGLFASNSPLRRKGDLVVFPRGWLSGYVVFGMHSMGAGLPPVEFFGKRGSLWRGLPHFNVQEANVAAELFRAHRKGKLLDGEGKLIVHEEGDRKRVMDYALVDIMNDTPIESKKRLWQAIMEQNADDLLKDPQRAIFVRVANYKPDPKDLENRVNKILKTKLAGRPDLQEAYKRGLRGMQMNAPDGNAGLKGRREPKNNKEDPNAKPSPSPDADPNAKGPGPGPGTPGDTPPVPDLEVPDLDTTPIPPVAKKPAPTTAIVRAGADSAKPATTAIVRAARGPEAIVRRDPPPPVPFTKKNPVTSAIVAVGSMAASLVGMLGTPDAGKDDGTKTDVKALLAEGDAKLIKDKDAGDNSAAATKAAFHTASGGDYQAPPVVTPPPGTDKALAEGKSAPKDAASGQPEATTSPDEVSALEAFNKIPRAKEIAARLKNTGEISEQQLYMDFQLSSKDRKNALEFLKQAGVIGSADKNKVHKRVILTEGEEVVASGKDAGATGAGKGSAERGAGAGKPKPA